jgi:hypothetical protein
MTGSRGTISQATVEGNELNNRLIMKRKTQYQIIKLWSKNLVVHSILFPRHKILGQRGNPFVPSSSSKLSSFDEDVKR